MSLAAVDGPWSRVGTSLSEGVHGKVGIARAVAANAFVCIVYTGLAWASLRAFATLNESASPVWPPTGVAFGLLLLWGVRLWPGIFVGAFVANLLAAGHVATSLAIATGNTLEAVVLAGVVRRFGGGPEVFDRTRHVAVFLAAALGAPVVSATVGVAALALGGLLGAAPLHSVWTTWWLGDAAGALLIGPLVVLFGRWETAARGGPPAGRRAEAGIIAALLLLVGLLLFSPASGDARSPLPVSFVGVPLVAWAALRFGAHGGVLATLVASAFGVAGTAYGHGPFSDLPANTGLLFAQFYSVTLAATGLAIGAIAHERTELDSLLAGVRASERRFRDIVESAPDATVIVDADGVIRIVNAQTERLFGYARGELVGRPVEVLLPERFRPSHPGHRRRFFGSPSPRLMGSRPDLAGRRKDGTEFPVEISLGAIGSEEGMLVAASVRDITARADGKRAGEAVAVR